MFILMKKLHMLHISLLVYFSGRWLNTSVIVAEVKMIVNNAVPWTRILGHMPGWW